MNYDMNIGSSFDRMIEDSNKILNNFNKLSDSVKLPKEEVRKTMEKIVKEATYITNYIHENKRDFHKKLSGENIKILEKCDELLRSTATKASFFESSQQIKILENKIAKILVKSPLQTQDYNELKQIIKDLIGLENKISELMSSKLALKEKTSNEWVHKGHELLNALEKIKYEAINKKLEYKESQYAEQAKLVNNPFEAFKNGVANTLSGYIKENQAHLVSRQLVHGPQIKCAETQITEQLIKDLLGDFNNIKFSSTNGSVFVKIENIDYNFSDTLKLVNFNHITLDANDLKNYQKLIDDDKFLYKPQQKASNNDLLPTEISFQAKDPQGICANLSFAEKEAINIYTGAFYETMNSLMRMNIDGAVKANSRLRSGLTEDERVNLTLKEALLHIAVAISALNKLPDFEIPSVKKADNYLFRGETKNCPNFVIENRKKAVKEGGEVTIELGFMSTSFSKPSGDFFNQYSKGGVLIQNAKGKNVMPLSQFGTSENEILLPPTQVQWTHHKEISIAPNKKMDLFIAKPVTVPTELSTIQNTEKAAAKDYVNKIKPHSK